ncbi:MAG: hypothetical protein Q8L48_23165 [Archangium sp.]|nr:hypothetical protein [Archangium sp.]
MAPRTFTVATSVQDPLTADRLVELLQEAKLDAFSRAGGAASSAAFASASPAFWDILVPTESFEQAETLIRTELQEIERDGEANAKAAEEEAMSGENPVAE